jgi:hypothetical protein
LARLVALLVMPLLGAVGTYAASGAADPAPASSARSFSLLGTIGAGTPVGHAGLALEGYLDGKLGLSVGAGISSRSPQLAAMLRVRIPLDTSADRSMTAISLGAGLSGGPYSWPSSHNCVPACAAIDRGGRRWDAAIWVNLDVAIERIYASGFVWRVFMGYAEIANVRDSTCYSTGCGGKPAGIPYVGASVGIAF